jgi:hypothetical protein
MHDLDRDIEIMKAALAVNGFNGKLLEGPPRVRLIDRNRTPAAPSLFPNRSILSVIGRLLEASPNVLFLLNREIFVPAIPLRPSAKKPA